MSSSTVTRIRVPRGLIILVTSAYFSPNGEDDLLTGSRYHESPPPYTKSIYEEAQEVMESYNLKQGHIIIENMCRESIVHAQSTKFPIDQKHMSLSGPEAEFQRIQDSQSHFQINGQ